jgi:hypothetical protein
VTAQGEWLWVMGEGKNFKNQEKEKMFQRVCLFKLESNFYIQQSNNPTIQQSNNPAIQQRVLCSFSEGGSAIQ